MGPNLKVSACLFSALIQVKRKHKKWQVVQLIRPRNIVNKTRYLLAIHFNVITASVTRGISTTFYGSTRLFLF